MLLQEATSGIYKQIWDVFDPSVGYVYTWDEGVEKVCGRYGNKNPKRFTETYKWLQNMLSLISLILQVLTGKFAYMNAQLGAEIRAIKRGIHNYHFAKNTFYPQGYAMALPSGSPYKGKLEKL